MQKSTFLSALALLMTCCTGKHPETKNASTRATQVEAPVPVQEIQPAAPDPFVLVALELTDSIQTDVFKKYGMAFSGNCYSCDIAHLQISGRQLTFINACEAKQRFTLRIESYVQNDREIRLETKDSKLVFSKIADAPVYALKVSGQTIERANLLLGKFYTFQDRLPKFEIHDCGDFQG